ATIPHCPFFLMSPPYRHDGGCRGSFVLIVPIDEAQDGMVLAAPVYDPRHPDRELLRAGFRLQPDMIGRLRQLDISCICADYPGLDDLDRHLGPMLSPARREMYHKIKRTLE